MKSRLLGAVSAFAVGIVSLSTNAAFIGRLETSPGSDVFQAYYDDQLDITWAANANIKGSVNWQDGLDTWGNQVAWAAGLTIGGVTGWRLPNMDVNGDGTVTDCSLGTQAACKDNEYGHLYYYGAGTTLGSGVTSSNPGPFSDIIPFGYWSGTAYVDVTNPNLKWFFRLSSGEQYARGTGAEYFAWAVRDGDVVPIPPALYLFTSGLIGLVGVARRKT